VLTAEELLQNKQDGATIEVLRYTAGGGLPGQLPLIFLCTKTFE
jgi:hypothetical protein